MKSNSPSSFDHYEIDLTEIKMHYVRKGSGTPLVMVHGWPGFWWEWNRIIGPLAEDFDVIAIDMRGFGDTEKPNLSLPGLYHTDCTVRDLAELIARLNLDRPVIVGHDFGSIVLHKFVRKHRDLVRHAVILNPVVPGFDERFMSGAHFGESWYVMFHQIDMAVDLVSSSRDACRTYFDHFLKHWAWDKNVLTADEIEVYVDNYMKPGNIHGGFNLYRAGQLGTFDNLDLTISDCPVSFLVGLDDPCVPSAWTDLVTRWYSSYSMEYVDGCGHFMMLEKPEWLIDRIRNVYPMD